MDKFFINNTFDKEIKHKNLIFFPLSVINIFELETYSDCFKIEKDYIPESHRVSQEKMVEYIKFMQMNDLDFMYKTDDETKLYVGKLIAILKLCTKNQDMVIIPGFEKNTGKAVFSIDNVLYDNDDYLIIRDIICSQNEIELPDFRKSKELRDVEKRAIEYRSKRASKTADIEEIIVALSVYTGWELGYIYNMPIRKFNKAITRADMKLHYEIYLASSMSGMVEFKDKSFIKHWLSKNEKNNKAMVEFDSVASKFNNSGGK